METKCSFDTMYRCAPHVNVDNVDVLGTNYSIVITKLESDEEVNIFDKVIKIDVEAEDKSRVLRGAVFNAFLFESGLTEQAYGGTLGSWAGVQLPKIFEVLSGIKAL